MQKNMLVQRLMETLEFLPDNFADNFEFESEVLEPVIDRRLALLWYVATVANDKGLTHYKVGKHGEELQVIIFEKPDPSQGYDFISVEYTNRKGFTITVDTPFC